MTKEFAHKVLDLVRAGANVPEQLIVRALVATGDIGGWGRA